MCEIQFIKRLGNKLTNDDLKSFDEMMIVGSYTNIDAWGYFNGKTMIRKEGSYGEVANHKRAEFLNRMANTNFLVGHNRYTTQGKANLKKNNHPFFTKDLVMVHNGVLSNDEEIKELYKLNYLGQTDSIVIIEAIQSLLNENYNIRKAIKEVAECLEGTYSVMLYYKKDKNLYYFKNKSTSFFFGLIRDGEEKILLGSTSSKNFAYTNLEEDMIFTYQKKRVDSVISADAGRIYLINNEGIFEKDTFTPQTTVIKTTYSDYQNGYDNWSGWQSNNKVQAMGFGEAKTEVMDLIKKFGFTLPYSADYTQKQLRIEVGDSLDNYKKEGLIDLLTNYGDLDDSGNWIMGEQDIYLMLTDYGYPIEENGDDWK